jgi:hypothetical protein
LRHDPGRSFLPPAKGLAKIRIAAPPVLPKHLAEPRHSPQESGRLSHGVISRLTKCVMAVSTEGLVTKTASLERRNVQELGHVYEIRLLDRISHPSAPFALHICVREHDLLITSAHRAECEGLLEVVCQFNPHLDQLLSMRHPSWQACPRARRPGLTAH